MLFTTDQQTLDDLNIFGKHGSDSVYQIFNCCRTRCRAAILEEMFRYPLSEEKAINQRSGIIRYFASVEVMFPFESSDFDAIEPYLNSRDERTKLSGQEQSLVRKLSNLVALDAETLSIHNGITALIELLKKLHVFVVALEVPEGHPYLSDKNAILRLLEDPAFAIIFKPLETGKLSATEMAAYDVLFRFGHQGVIQKLLRYIYALDVYFTAARVASERHFAFPKALPQDQHMVNLTGLYHAQVKNAVANSIEINPKSNVIFLTGANMAGKSTFMKALSIAVYLAHMGFPVAAAKMEFSVLDGIYTTINLPDDLGMGASHFYAEVLRAKKVANELRSKNLFVVFDELFRGTNVKDAGEATIAFTEAFARKVNSVFVISTHIIEAGDVLKERCDNINFVYLPTLMDGTNPVYTYKLKQGITEDRHGMIIINNEGILELLDKGITAEAQAAKKNQKRERFIADKQTVKDLNLLGKYNANSIFSLFNQVVTAGGERLLQEMFHQPLLDEEQINIRSSLFKYFGELNLVFPFKKERFSQAENYLGMGTARIRPSATIGILVKKMQASFLMDDQFEGIYSGLLATIEVLNLCVDFIGKLEEQDTVTSPYTQQLQQLHSLFADPRMQWIKAEKNMQDIPLMKVARYDYLLKHTLRDEIEVLLELIYQLDVYISVSTTGKKRGFTYAEAVPVEKNLMLAEALWHPALIKGVANPVSFGDDKNMIFLTGANMAGKSTFMKAFGIAVYLAHMGFPVAARSMQFSVRDGLYSSINVPDDLNMGYSHFYAEVLRVKKVAEEVGAGKNLVVLFDELFKGTNVKDAYDGTLAVTAAFSEYRNCFYIVSTHIIEVGEALQHGTDNLQFAYLPTIMDGNTPKYTYKIEQGITTDRQGMMIIENEGILDMLTHKK